MHTTDHDLRVVARTAELTASDDPDEDEEAWRFGGVAVGEGDILHTDDGTPVLFSADVLAEAAHTQAGEPLSKNHPEDDEGNPIYPPPVEETAGTVAKAGYVPGKGLVYEAKTHDETIAKGVKAGSFDVSVHPTFDLGEQDPETGAYIPENLEFLDLATVSKGMSASNTAEWGPNQALASWTREADIASEIDAHATAPPGDDHSGVIASTVRATLRGLGFSQSDLELTAQETPQEGYTVRWESDAGGDREPSDVRYGVVADELQDSDGDEVLVAVYQPTSDYDGWENRGEEEPILVENLEVVGTDGVESLPPVDQVTAAASNAADPAESGRDTATQSMNDNEREQYIQFITANGDYDEESLEAMDDDVLATTHELVAAATADDGDDGSTDTDDDGDTDTDGDGDGDGDGGTDAETLGDMTVDELGTALREQGFVTEDNASEIVDEATAQMDKAEKVEEIIAKSDDHDEDDREDLMASADALIEKEYNRVTAPASLPGMTGTKAQVAASAHDGEDDLDEYGTGVQGNN